MRVHTIIPARGGSKGIPRKNLAPLGGHPLVAWVIRTCQCADLHPVVSSEDTEILETAHTYGALTIDRPVALAGDLASSESVVLYALDVLRAEPDDIALLVQCTSPFVCPETLKAVVARATDEGTGCAGRRTHVPNTGAPREPRQARPREWQETGEAYATRVGLLRDTQDRFGGRAPEWVETVGTLAVEVDTQVDLEVARAWEHWVRERLHERLGVWHPFA